MVTMAPIGLLGKVPPRCRVRLLDASGGSHPTTQHNQTHTLTTTHTNTQPHSYTHNKTHTHTTNKHTHTNNTGAEIESPSSGSKVATVDVLDEMTGGSTKYPRNEQGGFFKIYQVCLVCVRGLYCCVRSLNNHKTSNNFPVCLSATQPNKWRMKQAALMEERAARKAAEKQAAGVAS